MRKTRNKPDLKFFSLVLPRAGEISEWWAKRISMGIITKRLGISKSSFYKYRKKYPDFRKRLEREDVMPKKKEKIDKKDEKKNVLFECGTYDTSKIIASFFDDSDDPAINKELLVLCRAALVKRALGYQIKEKIEIKEDVYSADGSEVIAHKHQVKKRVYDEPPSLAAIEALRRLLTARKEKEEDKIINDLAQTFIDDNESDV